MIRRAVRLAGALLLLVAGSPLLAGPIDKAALEAYVDGAVTAQLKHYHIPGASIVVIADGKPILLKGYGYADLERHIPVDPTRTVFRAASVSKSFNAVAVMQQVQAGRLRLDVDIGRYVDIPLRRATTAPITLGQLLTHTSGLEEGYFGGEVASPRDLVSLREMLRRTLPHFVHPPGSVAAYSNHGATLAGHIVERASGEEYAAYMRDHVLAPLGMTHSTFFEPPPPAPMAVAAKGYNYDSGRFTARPPMTVNIDPAGGLNTTAADMARFLIAMLNGGQVDGSRVLSPETTALMQACHYRAAPAAQCIAYGFLHMRFNGHEALVHAGDYDVFHANLVMLPDAHIGFAVFYNGAAGAEARDELTELIIDHLFPAPPQPSEAGHWRYTAADYAGHYLVNRRAESSWLKSLGVLVDSEVVATAAHRISRGGYSWRQVADDVFRNEDPLYGDEYLVFKRDGQGRIKSVLNSQWTVFESARIPFWQSAKATAAAVVAFLLGFVAILIWAIAGRRQRAGAGRPVRLLGWLLPLAGLCAIAGPAMIFGTLLAGDLVGFGPPPVVIVALLICNAALILFVASLALIVSARRDNYWTRGRASVVGLFLSTMVLVAALFVHWNFVGLQL